MPPRRLPRRALAAVGVALVALLLTAVVALGARSARSAAATARAAGLLATRFVDDHARVAGALADLASGAAPDPGRLAELERAARALGGRLPALGRIMLVDGAGRVLVGLDPGAPPGGERLAPGSVDPRAARRRAALVAGRPAREARTEAGVATALDLLAPVTDAAGAPRGYVALELELAPLARELGALAASAGVDLWLRDAAGRLLAPADRGAPPPGRWAAQPGGWSVLVVGGAAGP